MPIDPRFDWHPEPELIAITDEPVSRPALERLGAGAWGTALDYLYDEALRRAMGEPASYEALRHTFFGEPGGPAPAPSEPTPSAELLAEFTGRLAPHQLNAWHPRSLSYFTPPPLWMSIVGELLAQVTQQGVDVRLDGSPVADAIRGDRAAGLRPLAIAAVAGSTNTGSVDRISELADLAEREGLWLHVDAAYGAAARLSDRDARRMPDLDRADSVTVDPHKWFFQAYA